MELIFQHRARHGFVPSEQKSPARWLAEIAGEIVFLGKHLEQEYDRPLTPTATPPMGRNERLKRLALGQRLEGDSNQQQGHRW
jgi:hypothetical protein